jgi:hypothetical protein
MDSGRYGIGGFFNLCKKRRCPNIFNGKIRIFGQRRGYSF